MDNVWLYIWSDEWPEEFEDIKGALIIRNSKDRQINGQKNKKNRTNKDLRMSNGFKTLMKHRIKGIRLAYCLNGLYLVSWIWRYTRKVKTKWRNTISDNTQTSTNRKWDQGHRTQCVEKPIFNQIMYIVGHCLLPFACESNILITFHRPCTMIKAWYRKQISIMLCHVHAFRCK